MATPRPKAIDGVMVHSKSKTGTKRIPKTPTLSKDMQDGVSSHRAAERKIFQQKQNSSSEPLARTPFTTEPSTITRAHWYILAVSVVVLVVLIPFFGKVHITVWPSTVSQSVALNGENLNLKSISVNDQVTEFVTATGSEQYESYAVGQARLFNEEAKPQAFSAKTRIEAANGKIYFLPDQQITVPAAAAGTPGFLDVTITASEPGGAYNQTATDFVILGWKTTNNPKVKTQYVRSLTAITGGGKGTRPVVDKAELDKITQTMTTKLTSRLGERALKESPLDWAVVPGTQTITVSEPVVSTKDNQKAQISLPGTLTAKLISRSFLAERTVSTKNPLFNYTTTDLSQAKMVNGQLTGTVLVQPVLTEVYIDKLFLGLSKKKALQQLQNEPLIARAQIRFWPFWKHTIPKKSSQVGVTISNVVKL